MTNSVRSEDRQATRIGALVHLIGFMLGPFGAALVVRHSKNEFTQVNARNALNWQLAVYGVIIIGFLMGAVLINLGASMFVTYAALVLVVLFNVVSCPLAAYRATRGEAWEYPFEPKFV